MVNLDFDLQRFAVFYTSSKAQKLKSDDITLPGSNISGTVPVSVGGTGQTILSAVSVGKANTLTTGRDILTNLESSVASNFNGTASVAPGTSGILPVSRGGTGVNNLNNITVGKTNSLSTARALQVSLSSTVAANFDGSADVKTIGVQGVLQPAQGGTGKTNLGNVTVGTANSLTSAKNITASLSTTLPASFDGSGNVTVGTQGVLPISKGGTGATTAEAARASLGLGSMAVLNGPLSEANGGTGTNSLANITVGSATKAASLQTARALQVSLNSTASANFQGNTDVKTIGVQGTLQPAQGGTGQTILSAVTVGSANIANSLSTARALQVSLNKDSATNFQGNANVTNIGIQGILQPAHGGTGQSVLSAVAVGSATSATRAASLTTARALQVSLGNSLPSNFQGNTDVKNIGVTGVLGVSNGGTGVTTINDIKAGKDANGSVISSTYLKISEASSTYLTKTDASSNYLGKSAKAASATSADSATTATTAGSLTTARSLQVSLNNTSASDFKGNANVTNIGVQGTLQPAQGGTGQTVLSSVTVGAATKATQDGSGNNIASTYLTTSAAATTYLTKSDANSTYLGKSAKAASATTADSAITATTAASLTTARSLQVSLGKTSATNFQGNANVNDIGVQGTLGVANGGTGTNNLANVTVGKANTLTTARALQVSLSSTSAPTFNGTADVKNIGVTGILPVANGGTGTNSLANITAGKANTLTTAHALQVSLSSTGAPTFNGTADVKNIGVQGILPVANGGTGANSLANITVGKANTLTTARALQVSLSSTGAPTFNGTADVKNIGVTGVLPIANGGTGTSYGLPIANVVASGSTSGNIDAITAFRVGSTASNKTFNIPAANIKVEYSRDSGATWIDYGLTDSQKKDLFSETRITNVYLGKATTKADNNVNNMLRITINPNDRYVSCNMFYLWGSTNGSTWFAKLEVQTWANHDTTTWTTLFENKQMSGWSGNNVVYFSQVNGFNRIDSQGGNMYALRFTFHQTAINANYQSACLSDIRCYGVNWWSASNDIVKSNRLYHWDADLNAYFPASITASGFNGTATKALQDGSGNNIASTYLTTTAAANNYLGKTAKAASATTADSATTATTAGSLTSARSLQVSLNNTSAASFRGNADVTTIGVQGTLPVANGGTGTNSLANITVGAATKDGSGNNIASTYLTTTAAANNYLGKTAKAASATTADSATSATKATNDGSNRSIVDTYETKANAITGLSASGNTITITKGNGTTSTIGVTGSSQDLSGYLTKTEASSTYLGKTAKAASASTADSASNANYANSAGSAGSATSANTAGQVTKTLTGTNVADLLYSQIASNDYARIRVGGTADNAGYIEIATADDGNEPIYVRQYTGVFATLTRTATLLDANGNTSFPGTVSATSFSGNITGYAKLAGDTFTGNVTIGSASAPKGLIFPNGSYISSPRTTDANTCFSGIKINNDHISGYGADVLIQGGQQLIIASGECGQRSYLNAYNVGKLASIPSGDENLYILSDQKVILRTNCQDILSTAEDIAQFVFDNTGVTAERYILKDKAGTGIGNLFDNNHFSGLCLIGRNAYSVQYGYDVLVQGGNKLILAAGECGKWAYNNANAGDAYIEPSSSTTHEAMYIYADRDIFVRTNCDTLTACKTFKFGADGKFTAPTIVGSRLSGAAVLNNTSKGALSSTTWSSTMDAALKVVTANTIAYWNGAYNNTSSNLAYCNRGAFGTIVTKNTGDYLGASATAAAATKLATGRTLKVSLNSTAASTAFDGTAAISNIGVAGTLAIANGGTGLTASPSMLTNLGSTTAANVLAASPRPGVTGTLSVAHGGTGTSVAGFCWAASENCTTAANTAAKVVACPGFKFLPGSMFTFALSNTHTGSTSPTLNVNSTGAKAIYNNGTRLVKNTLVAGRYFLMVAANDCWIVVRMPG